MIDICIISGFKTIGKHSNYHDRNYFSFYIIYAFLDFRRLPRGRVGGPGVRRRLFRGRMQRFWLKDGWWLSWLTGDQRRLVAGGWILKSGDWILKTGDWIFVAVERILRADDLILSDGDRILS